MKVRHSVTQPTANQTPYLPSIGWCHEDCAKTFPYLFPRTTVDNHRLKKWCEIRIQCSIGGLLFEYFDYGVVAK